MNQTHHQLTNDNVSNFAIIWYDGVTMQKGTLFDNF